MDNEDMSLRNHFENRIQKELINTGKLKTPVSCIFHGIDQVNAALSDGHYFFTDIKKEGIVLFAKSEVELIEPRFLTPQELQQKSLNYFNQWFNSASDFIETFEFDLNRNKLFQAAFLLHQATERFYVTILLVFTGYRPQTHSLDTLSFRAEILDERFKEAFPRETDDEKILF